MRLSSPTSDTCALFTQGNGHVVWSPLSPFLLTFAWFTSH